MSLGAWQLRERDWCNVISAHEGDTAAYTWRLSHLSLGEHVLRPRRKRERGADAAHDAPVTAVAISCCGNFGLVGTAAGRVDRYNMQSGLHRGSYNRHAANIVAILLVTHKMFDGEHECKGKEQPVHAESGTSAMHQDVRWRQWILVKDRVMEGQYARREKGKSAHEGAVVGVAADACNKLLVTGGLDGRLRIWAFKGRQMRDEIALGSPPTHLCHHANSALLSVACDDLVIRM